jgi:hypothetical protein
VGILEVQGGTLLLKEGDPLLLIRGRWSDREEIKKEGREEKRERRDRGERERGEERKRERGREREREVRGSKRE